MAGFIPTSFFLAYAIMSIPAGIMIDKIGDKKVLFIGFLMPFCGTILFASFPSYGMLLASCFIIGLGMAMLQTVLNPLQRVAGGEENYAFVAELAQFVFGIASFISPLVYIYLVKELNPKTYIKGNNLFIDFLAKLTPPQLPWVSLYWLFAIILLLMLFTVLFIRVPRVKLTGEEKAGSTSSYIKLFKKGKVWLFFLGIFSYVSTEQGIANFMTTFLEKYHNVDPQLEGATAVSHFWGLMTVGCIVGMILLKLYDCRKVLLGSGILSTIFLLLALFGSTSISIVAFPTTGFCISVMYSIVFSLALNSVSMNHGSFAGILCSGIVGGAGGPIIVSAIADITNLRVGMLFILIFIFYITSIGVWARPLIDNKTVRLKELFKRN